MPTSEPRSNPPRGGTVVHLAYAGLQARFELITRFLPRLESASPLRRWFFVDVPIDATSGLEVMQLHAKTDRSARVDLVAWLDACRAARLVTAATFADTAWVLDPGLFLNHRVPEFYPAAMAAGSARAAMLLDRVRGKASEQEVADEISTLYAELVPARAARLRALDLYATWLERTAAGTADQPAATAARPDRDTVRASLVARLAHTQAVRLLGPDYPGGLNREATLVRSLLRQASSTTS